MKKIINTSNAPAPIGPYSQAVLANGFLYVSGQIPINPATGELSKDSIKAETEQVMRNLNAVLMEAGFEFKHIIKTTIFLSDMALFNEVNEVYAGYFKSEFPARETVAVKGLPKAVNVEISVIAYKG
ncbi:RidA family protein [Pedobacter antarcticus]|uniref:RidA family protein n=1 Tax=Pedobacter antarcticus TaxID=34086 RepID=UPI001C575751|nr:RidA family protein [Pedobacter antarcticus]